MSKHDGTLTRRWKVSVPNRNVSSKVSKVSSICGYLLAFCCFSIWISSPFVTADKHTYGSINETNGLCVCGSYLSSPFDGNFSSISHSVKIHIFSIHSRRSDIESANIRTYHTRAHKLHHNLQICTQSIGWTNIVH